MSQGAPSASSGVDRAQAMGRGMLLAVHAAEAPDRPAIISRHGDRTFGELNARSNQLVRALRDRGISEESSIAVLIPNRPEFAEPYYAASRAGWRFIPINWHLGAEEVAYVIDDCEAEAFVADARFAEVADEAAGKAGVANRLAVGGPIPGFESYEDLLRPQPGGDIDDPVMGRSMLYTSGTTGRPKGVSRPPAGRTGAGGGGAANLTLIARYGYQPGQDMHLITGPLYHSAPLLLGMAIAMAVGVGCVFMDGWDPEETLRLIERHKITHVHLVPTMFVRLLGLPDKVRDRYDISTLRFVLHGAAPCPVEVKKATIDWLGPIVFEYYAATEGWGTFVTSEEWLERPGSVGKPEPGQIEIRGEDGSTLPPGEVGTLYLKAPEVGRFEYYKDPEKTASAYSGDYFTLGDMGYFDEQGHLFLADRTADLIISGGVNIYPAEVDGVLITHPAVYDVATVGIPNEEWGEEVKSVVQLKDGYASSLELEKELIDFARERLAHYKCPRSVDFVDELPRTDTGKIYRRLVRERYWTDRKIKI